MSPENASTFKTPSQLRIHQRLGQLRSNEIIRERLFTKVERLGGMETTPEKLVADLVSYANEVADDPELMIGVLAYNYVPRCINILVADESRQTEAFEAYAVALEALKQQQRIQ
jgi:hypothetical protein